jgi:hypothetical protein
VAGGALFRPAALLHADRERQGEGRSGARNKRASVPELPDGYEHNYAATIGGPVNIPKLANSNNTRPQRVTVIGSYDFPFGKGKYFLRSGWGAKVAGGWKMSGTYVYQPGPLLSWNNLFFYGNLSDIPLDSPTLAQWFNTANFNRASGSAPNSFQARIFPSVIDGVRADKTSQINTNIQREFVITERYRLLARLDVLNVMNRSQFDVPSTDPLNTNFGKVTAQTTAQNRFLQVQVRFRF